MELALPGKLPHLTVRICPSDRMELVQSSLCRMPFVRVPSMVFFLQGVEGTASQFIPLAGGGRLTAVNAPRQWTFDVVRIYKYHFCAWPLSTDTCQVLHAN